MGENVTEVVVVGAGIAGAATALALRDRGAAVNLVDAERPGAAATGASAGMLAAQYEAPEDGPLLDLMLRAREDHPAFTRRLETVTGLSLHVRADGMLVANLDADEERRARDDASRQRAAGHRARVVDPEEALELQPGLSREVPSWLWLPDEGQVDTQALVEVLPAALRASDLRLLSDTAVARVDVVDGSVEGVTLDDGRTLGADAVVVAAGAWSRALDGLPRPVPVRPVRGQMLRFPAGAVTLRRLVATHGGRYLVPRDDGSVLAGSTMDEVGFDRSVTDEGEARIRETVEGLLPALRGVRPSERWADLRPISADLAPILGPDPGVEGLFYCTGFGRNGILLGPLAGEITAALVMGGDPPADWRPFGIGRFSGR